jgi:aminopeptidase
MIVISYYRRSFSEQKLDLLAEVAVKVGLGLQSGQELVMTASLDALPLARRITEQAYRAGASLVTTLYTDDEATLMRYRYAPDASFDHAAKWLYDGMGAAFKSGAARLAIAGGNPALLSNEDPGKVGRANQRRLQGLSPRPRAHHPPRHQLDHRRLRHARLGRADVPQRRARRRPRQAVGSHLPDHAHQHGRSRRRVEDPRRRLHQRAAYMNEKRFSALQYRGPGTDFKPRPGRRPSLARRRHHRRQRLYCIPNMPTEEVFTTPHKDRADGTVTATKPLSHRAP